VDIGKVSNIQFDPANVRTILIDIAIRSDVKLTRSAFAELRYQGVTGLSYVMLDDPGTSPEQLPQMTQPGSSRIPIHESLFSNLAEAGQAALADARELMKRMGNFLSDENQAQVSHTLQNIEGATRQIVALTQGLQPAARNSEALVADARKTFQTAEKLLTEISDTNRQLATRLEAVDRVAGSAEKAGDAVVSLANNVASETLPRVNALADELARTSRSLDRLATSLREQPQSVVFGRKATGLGPGESEPAARSKANP
jgi:phospholipid/cholesterol/gamma-HCH transport system substrate-binding protein